MRRPQTLAALAFALSFLAAAPALADIVGTGDVSPTFPWSSSTFGYVGQTSDGSLTIILGSILSSFDGYLGYDGAASGQVLVTDPNSCWNLGSNLYVGYSGGGVLTIEAGGKVSNSYGYVGYSAGSTGTATVTGTGSTWTNSYSLYVGYGGAGTLRVDNGATVTAKTLYASLANLSGNGTIMTQGAVLDANLIFDATHPVQQTITFGSGGSLKVYPSASVDFGVGYKTAGTLRIADGIVLSSSSGYLGYNAGSTGTATITGAGSTWTNSYGLYVGAGTLKIEAGGKVSNYYGFLGYGAGATGTATVTGAGSTWTNSSDLYIGYGGAGTLRVENGATVTAKTLYASLANLSGNGTITTQGAVLDANLIFDATHPVQQTITFGSGGSLKVNPNASVNLGVGYKTAGTLRIADGIVVSSSSGYLGYNAGCTGAATITGIGSRWTINNLYVGYRGEGTLTVGNGATVTAKTIFASLGNLLGNGTITTQGAVLDADLIFDAAYPPQQTITFGSGGSLNVNPSASGSLGVGYKGTGTLQIADGAAVSSLSGYLGYNSGSTGTATVTGAGSMWTNSGNLYIGNWGAGILKVEAGGKINNTVGYLGTNTNSTGTATVTGAGSMWTNSGNLYIGNWGAGILKVEAGGKVDNTIGYLGTTPGAIGTATVAGAGSTWTNSGGLYIGNSGAGTLAIDAGGTVSNPYAYLGPNAGSTGTATVTGAGSTWTNSGTLFVGFYGTGTLMIESSGKVSNALGYLGYDVGSTGTVTVTGTGSMWTNNGILSAGRHGTGTLKIDAGGQVRSNSCYLGEQSGSSGTARVTGAGSTWTNSDSLWIGSSGTGTLKIEAGGQVNSNSCYLGEQSGSSGTATITGAGSTWTNGGDLFVGFQGVGTLTVDTGGMVTTKTIYASLGNLLGNGTITTNGAVLDASLVFDATHPILQTLAFGTGGSLTLNPNSSAALGAGYKGTGTLRIADGIAVASANGWLGYNSGSNGTATVTGSGSMWTNSGRLYVGTGTLTVSDGGTVTATTLYASLADLSGNGTITTQGAILDANLVFDATHPILQTLAFGSGGSLTLNPNSSADLGAGHKGTGSLRIADGIAVASANGYLGYTSGSSGTATVTGSGSMWTSSVLDVGEYGAGTLNIGDSSGAGGLVIAKTLTLATYSGAGSCTIDGGGILQAQTIAKGSGAATFNWTDGAIRNYDTTTDLTISAGLTLKLAATGAHTLNIDLNRTGTVNAVLSDATTLGTLAKTGPGKLILSGVNTYTGTTNIAAGTLSANKIVVSSGGSSLGNATSSVILGDSINEGTLLYTGGSATYIRGFTVNAGGGQLTNSGTGALTVKTGGIAADGLFTVGGASQSITINSTISGTGGLTKTGANTVILSAANTFTGEMTIAAGTLSVGNIVVSGGGSNLGNATSPVVLGDSTNQGTLLYSGGAATYTRGFTVNSGGGQLTNSGTGTLTVDTGAIGAGGLFTVGGASQNITINSTISGGGGLTKTGANAVILSAANFYTGNTTISAGTLQLGNNLALQNSALDTSGTGTLAFSTGINTPTFGGLVGSGNRTLASNVTGLTLNLGSGVTKSYSGILGSATAGMTLTKNGLGTQVLSGANTYTGKTTVQAGTLVLGIAAQNAVVNLGGADLQAGKIVFDYTGGTTPAATVAGLLGTSYSAGAWNVGQFQSTTADSTHGLGWVDDGVSQVKVAYTFYGDADLNGTVNSADLAKVLANYNMSGMAWSQGDFDYNGTVNSADLAKVLANYNLALPDPGISGSFANLDAGAIELLAEKGREVSAVPEPGTVALLMTALAGLLVWQRKGKSGDRS